MRDFPTSRISDLLRLRGSIPALLATPSSRQGARMKNSVTGTAGSQDRGDSRDDAALFAFTDTLRLSIREKVAAEQSRGLSLSEIVIQVREMVRVAEEDARHPRRFPARAFRAISRQAVAWCVESYRPLVFAVGIEPSKTHAPISTNPAAAEPLPAVVAPVGTTQVRFPAMSPTYRGLP